MARGGNIEFSLNSTEVVANLEAAISRVANGSIAATTAACEEILQESFAQVPEHTGTLASSGYYEIYNSYGTITGIVGYGGNGDPVNPETGKAASDYMLQVHEDLDAFHPNGKAKYLEDPINDYAAKGNARIATIIADVLA